ncbi:hypothetical protein COOONC_18525 [Cooperia oncophora]
MRSISLLCKELSEQLDKLKQENADLRKRYQILNHLPLFLTLTATLSLRRPPYLPQCLERTRSIVISGLIESKDPIASSRVLYDYQSVRDNYGLLVNRLSDYWDAVLEGAQVKVILPSSFLVKVMLRRERRFKLPGLPRWAERERLRAEPGPPQGQNASNSSPDVVSVPGTTSSQLNTSNSALLFSRMHSSDAQGYRRYNIMSLHLRYLR